MKLYRYLGEEELEKILHGETIEGRYHANALTTSRNERAVYFLKDKADDKESKYTIFQALNFLKGVADTTFLAEFEVSPLLNIKKHYGLYADIEKDLSGDLFDVMMNAFNTKKIKYPEYTVASYSNSNFKLTKLWIVDWVNDEFEEVDLERLLRENK
ncbi:MAG: hypothetical protein LBV67_06205 [Streptococcaceae bacterium]|jgi:hypothetical protein|nr:hypothetical protein [Streptococcaceae bacterium]